MTYEEIIEMKKFDAQYNAMVETLKEFARWILSAFIGFVIDNGYSFFTKSKLSPDVIFVIGAFFRAADYYWHKYQKQITPESEGQSLGLVRF